VHQLYVPVGGVGGTRHAELAERLTGLGVRSTVITSGTNYLSGAGEWSVSPTTTSGPRVLRAWSTAGRGSGFVNRVLSFVTFTVSSFLRGLFVRDVDVVFGTTPPLFQALTGLALARLKRVPYLLEVRDLWPDFAVALGALRHPGLIAIARRLEAVLYRAADVVVVNSPGFVEHVRAGGARRVEVIPNGVDPAHFEPHARGEAVRAEWEVGDRMVAVYAGAHGVPNDLDTVLSAAAKLRDRDDIAFVLVGGGRKKAELVARAQRENLSNVRFVDPQPKARMAQILAGSDVGLAVLGPIELFRTVYPNKVFDYMAAGRPTVLLIDGVIREVVENGRGGTYVAPGDVPGLAAALERYADDPRLRRVQGAAARDYVTEHFHRATHAQALAALVFDLTGTRLSAPEASFNG